jgi:hypothetical protein
MRSLRRSRSTLGKATWSTFTLTTTGMALTRSAAQPQWRLKRTQIGGCSRPGNAIYKRLSTRYSPYFLRSWAAFFARNSRLCTATISVRSRWLARSRSCSVRLSLSTPFGLMSCAPRSFHLRTIRIKYWDASWYWNKIKANWVQLTWLMTLIIICILIRVRLPMSAKRGSRSTKMIQANSSLWSLPKCAQKLSRLICLTSMRHIQSSEGYSKWSLKWGDPI